MRTRLLWLSLFLLVGCEQGGSAPAPTPTVFSEHAFHAVGRSDRRPGEPCVEGGASECASGLCLRVPGAEGGGSTYVCSAACADASQCPSGWGCQAVMPGTAERVCFPPASPAPAAP